MKDIAFWLILIVVGLLTVWLSEIFEKHLVIAKRIIKPLYVIDISILIIYSVKYFLSTGVIFGKENTPFIVLTGLVFTLGLDLSYKKLNQKFHKNSYFVQRYPGFLVLVLFFLIFVLVTVLLFFINDFIYSFLA